MNFASVKVFWEPSVSTDVEGYKVLVLDEDTQEVLEDKFVSAAETSVVVTVEEDSNITATIIANDGTNDSEPTSESFYVGDLTAPLPVGLVGFEIVEVFVDSEEDEILDEEEEEFLEEDEFLEEEEEDFV